MAYEKFDRQKGQREKQLALYDVLRTRGRYQGLPRHATFWKQVLDATSGHGIRPYRRPGGGWMELEEYLGAVPLLLRNRRDGVPPDEVADMLGLEGGDQELYDLLLQDNRPMTEREVAYFVDEDSEISLGLELDAISLKLNDGGK